MTNEFKNNPLQDNDSVKVVSNRFEKCILTAAKVIPRGCRHDPVMFWCSEIDEAIKLRDSCRHLANVSEADRCTWIDACANVTSVISTKQQESWRNFATSDLRFSVRPADTAKVVKQICREQRSSDSVSIVLSNGKLLSSDEDKALAFRRQYSTVCGNDHSKGPMSRDEKSLSRKDKKLVSDYCNSDCFSIEASNFTSEELDSCLYFIPNNSSCGPDKIYNEMLKNLDDNNRIYLLQLVNSTWNDGDCPRSWLLGNIIPLPKAGKDKTKLESFRPVCLMRVIA